MNIMYMYSPKKVQDYLEIYYPVLITGVHQSYPSCLLISLHFDMMYLNLLNDFD